MGKQLLLFVIILFSKIDCFSQYNVGIGTTTPDINAILDLQSTNQGILVPRLTANQRAVMSQSLGIAQKGLLVFDNDSTKFFYWNGIMWLTFQTGPQGPPGVATVQSHGVIGSSTSVTSLIPNWTLVSGLSVTINLVDTATINIFTNGRINPLSQSYDLFAYVQIFVNGTEVPNALQTINMTTNLAPNAKNIHWSFAYPMILPAGSYVFEVKTSKYFQSSTNYYVSENNESSLIVQVFY